MSVQRAEVHWARYLDGNRRVVLEADHARIVAEAGAAVFAFHPEWTVTGMCDPDCLACRRLTELITEREKGYEEGKADAEQEHAAAWDRATFDSTAYEQGKRDAAEEARAAERRHWEARFRNAEAAHAAALAEERQRVLSMRFTEFMAAIKKSCPCICHEYTRDINPHDGKCVCNGGDGMETLGAAAPRTLTADDPEPAVTSVGLDRDQSVWQRVGSTEHSRWVNPFMGTREWSDVLARGPVRLLHDGGAA